MEWFYQMVFVQIFNFQTKRLNGGVDLFIKQKLKNKNKLLCTLLELFTFIIYCDIKLLNCVT